MSGANDDDDFNGLFIQYDWRNNNGESNYDGEAWFSTVYGDFVDNSQPTNILASALLELDQSLSSHPHHKDSLGLNVEEAIRHGGGRVGLKLTKTPSFLSSLNELDSYTNKKMKKKPDNSKTSAAQSDNSYASPEKLKAANFPALSLRIGTWMLVSRNEGDLVAKCYFKKKKLVWEVLDGTLKRKIEFQWSDISAIRAIFPLDGPAILDVMLEKKPLFFAEVNPLPRKHTVWEPSYDFTSDQATLIRRHTLITSQGVLEKHYEKLLKADKRLHELSKQPFPNNASPFFKEIQFDNDQSFNNLPNPLILHQFLPNFPQLNHQSNNSLGHLGISSTVTPLSSVDFPVHNNDMSNYPVDETLDYHANDPNRIPDYLPPGSTYYSVQQDQEDYSVNVNNHLQQIPPTMDVPYLGFDQMSNDFETQSFFGGGASWM